MPRLCTKSDWQSVTKSLAVELEASVPNEAVIRSLAEFIATAPLPLPDLQDIKPEQCWSRC